jgi:hypothetical protein
MAGPVAVAEVLVLEDVAVVLVAVEAVVVVEFDDTRLYI